MTDLVRTYRDGTGAQRCCVCNSRLRTSKGGEPFVSIQLKDAEDIARLVQRLIEGSMQPDELSRPTYIDIIRRLEETVGQTLRHMEAE